MKRGTPEHPKTLDLARRLDSRSRFEAIGILEMLWHWTARFAPQGDLGRWTDEQIEAGIGWSGPGPLIPALVAARWLDADRTHRLIVHDWADHADDATKKALLRKGLGFVQTTADNGGRSPAAIDKDGGQNPPAVAVPCRAVALPLPEPEPLPPIPPPDVRAEKSLRAGRWKSERRLLTVGQLIGEKEGKDVGEVMRHVTAYKRPDGTLVPGRVNPASLSDERLEKSLADAEAWLAEVPGGPA